jgi:DNA polymerase V
MKLNPIRPLRSRTLSLPFYLESIRTGFPGPVDECIEKGIDLNDHLIQNPPATFLLRVAGDSMKNARIRSGDILIVDCSIPPKSESIVVASLDGELTLRRYVKREDRLLLVAENDSHSTIEIPDPADFIVWGVVTHIVHAAA